jgi:lipopolysaccharide exporter
VIGLVAQNSFYSIATYICHPYRPRLSLKRRAELLGTSLWIFVHQVTQTVQMQIERLVMGRFPAPTSSASIRCRRICRRSSPRRSRPPSTG